MDIKHHNGDVEANISDISDHEHCFCQSDKPGVKVCCLCGTVLLRLQENLATI